MEEFQPEMASANGGSMNFCYHKLASHLQEPLYDWEVPYVTRTYDNVFKNTFKDMEYCIRTMNKCGTLPEYEVFDYGQLNNLAFFKKEGVITQPIYIQFVPGVKDGREVGVLEREEINENVLYEKMVGRLSSEEYYKEARQKTATENVIFEVKDLGLFGCFKNVSFKLHENEVLGLCGVVGSGKEELCEVISGVEAASSGEMFLRGKRFDPKAPCAAVKAGVVCIPQERNEEGMLGSLSIYENITISNFGNVSNCGLISKNKQIEKSNAWIKDLNIKCPSCRTDMNSLSGGNAQKVVFARALNSEAAVLLLNHPTRGVDVGAKEEIYSLIRDAVDSGMGVIVLGDTLDECIGLSSRIIVLKDGLVSKEFACDVGHKPSQVEIVKYMM